MVVHHVKMWTYKKPKLQHPRILIENVAWHSKYLSVSVRSLSTSKRHLFIELEFMHQSYDCSHAPSQSRFLLRQQFTFPLHISRIVNCLMFVVSGNCFRSSLFIGFRTFFSKILCLAFHSLRSLVDVACLEVC